MPTTPTIDTFDYSANPISAHDGTWTDRIATGDGDLATNGTQCGEAIPEQTEGASAYRNNSSPGPNCEVWVVVDQVPAGSVADIQLFVRLQGGIGSGTPDGYSADCRIRDHGVSQDEWRLFRWDAGTRTVIGSSVVGPNLVGGDLITVTMVNTTLGIWVNGGLVNSTTSATYTAAGRIGVYLNGGLDGADVLIGSFGGGTLGGVTRAMHQYRQRRNYLAERRDREQRESRIVRHIFFGKFGEGA
jgi:hypothetical protein